MSTDPTIVLDPTAATEAVLDIDSIKEMMDAFDPAALLPELTDIFGFLTTVCQIAVMIAPIILLGLGLAYLFFAPREANYYFGYRCYFGMGSEYAWRFTQRLAGFLFTGAGLVLSVVMFAISIRFTYMQLPDMVWKAASCLVVELIASVLLILIVNISAAIHFDRKGKHRRKRRR